MTRPPQAFLLDEEPASKSRHTKTAHRKPRAVPVIEVTEDVDDHAVVTLPTMAAARPARRFRWGMVLVSALFTLATLWAGLAITQLVESFFVRSPWLGWLALAVAGLAGLAALAICLREIWGLMRLGEINSLQEKAARAINLDDAADARDVISRLDALYRNRPEHAWAMAKHDEHRDDILDPRDRITLAEKILLRPLDEQAHRIIARRARRVTLLTTVTPAAILDILFVAAINLGMLRELATLYGGRPSTLSTLKLARMVITHLAVTGGIALSDNLIQHVIGKGLLGRLSARFGEGAVNGILTARIGIAALDVCRPLPTIASNRETLGKLLREVVSFAEKPDKGAAPEKTD